jgi:predicted nucleic acid-binding protein
MLTEAMARRLRRDWSGLYHIEMTSGVLEAALEVADREALKGADAIHLGSALIVAEVLRRRATELVFVASDRELKQAAAHAGFVVIDPAEK